MKHIKYVSSPLLDLPTPSSINLLWNFGFMLGISMSVQIITGFFLSMSFVPSESEAFLSVVHMMRDSSSGWIIRLIHSNMASMIFVTILLHLARGLFNNSFVMKKQAWNSGVTMLILSMAAAFFGYVLPWGQMSYWGATVITNIASALPYIGISLVKWMWGNFSVSQPTLNRFFSIHFIIPFLITFFILIHILLLHNTGSSSPLGTKEDLEKIEFGNSFTFKDVVSTCVSIIFIILIISNLPDIFMDPENMNEADSLKAPVHIQPEWYFLFAYAILRSITSKLGGVVALVASIGILYVITLKKQVSKSNKFSPIKSIKMWSLISVFLMLTVFGSKPVEPPFFELSKLFGVAYFTLFMICHMTKPWKFILQVTFV